MRDEESYVHRALMKYLDAWCLSPDSWEFNLHVGRLLLLQGRSGEALQHLQSGLALRPLHPTLRSCHRRTVGSRSRNCDVSCCNVLNLPCKCLLPYNSYMISYDHIGFWKLKKNQLEFSVITRETRVNGVWSQS